MGLDAAAARRLAASGRAVVRHGLTDGEFEEVEQRYGFRFADDWVQALTGGSPWLTHDAGPEVEVVGEDLRVWQDRGSNLSQPPLRAPCRRAASYVA